MASNVVEVIIRARDEASGVVKKFEGNLKLSAAALAVLTGVAVATTGSLVSAARETANYGEELQRVAAISGVSVEKLSLLRMVAEQNETSAESLTTGFRFLQRAQAEAVKGSDEQIAAFKRIGISVQDLKKLSTEDLFRRVVEGIRGVGSDALRTSTILTLLGRSGADLAPLLRIGVAAMDEGIARAKQLGAEVTTASAALSDQFNDSVGELHVAVTGLKREIGEQLLPAMIQIAQQATDSAVAIREFAAAHPVLIRAMADTSAQAAVLGSGLLVPLGSIVLLRAGLAALGVTLTATGALITGGIIAALVGLGLAINHAREAAREPIRLRIETVTDIPTALEELKRLGDERHKLQDEIAALEKKAAAPPPTVLREKGGRIEQPVLEATGELERKKELLKELDANIARLGVTIEKLNPKPISDIGSLADKAKGPVLTLQQTLDGVSFPRETEFKIKVDSKSATDAVDDLPKHAREALARYENLNQEAQDKIAASFGETRDEFVADLRVMGLTADDVQKSLQNVADTDLAGPFEQANPRLAEFLKLAGLSSREIEDLGHNLRQAGIEAESIWAGFSSGLAAVRKEIESGILQPTLVVAAGVHDAIVGAVGDAGNAIGGFVGDLAAGGERARQAWQHFGETAHRVLIQFIADLVAAIAKAYILKAVGLALGLSGGGTVTAAATGNSGRAATGGTIAGAFTETEPHALRLSSGGSIPMLSRRQVARLAQGGLIAPAAIGAATAGFVHGRSGFSVPGAISKVDYVPALLAPKEIVLPTVAGRAPEDLIREQIATNRTLLSELQRRDSGGQTNVTFLIKSNDAYSVKEAFRRGAFREEIERMEELGR